MEPRRANQTSAVSVAVCIVFYEKPDQTVECIESVLRSDGHQASIYVLNNGSSDESVNVVRQFVADKPTVRYIHSDQNLGPAGGRNRLITEAKEDWILFMDSDVKVASRGWLRSLARAARQNPEAEVFIPRLYNKHDYFFCQYRSFQIEGDRLGSAGGASSLINNFPGGASMVSRRLFERLGTYDENLFGFEDWDFAIRALVAGKPIQAKLISSILLIHDHRKATREVDRMAAEVRYDSERAAKDYNRILKKYGLVMDDNYLQWIQRQKEQIHLGTTLWSTGLRFLRKRLAR